MKIHLLKQKYFTGPKVRKKHFPFAFKIYKLKFL